MKRKWLKIVLLALFWLTCFFTIRQYVTLEFLQQKQDLFVDYYNQHPVLSILMYMVVFVVISSLGLPTPYIFTLFSGYIFGTWLGLIISSISCCIHCILTFLLSRHFLREFIQNRFEKNLKSINKGLEENGVFYLIFLRVSLLTPIFWVNCACGITYMKLGIFILISVVATLPLMYIFASSGQLLGEITSLMDLYDGFNLMIYLSSIIIAFGLIKVNFIIKNKNKKTSF